MVNNPSRQILFVALAALLVVFIYHGNVLVNPGSYMFSTTGDGIKNYYTFVYHTIYDDSALEFGGMNWPFGEHVIFIEL